MELSGLPPSVIVYIVVSILPALAAFGLLALIARIRATHLWLVPGWLAAAAIGPVLAAFFGVRLIINTFSDLATRGGGIGAVSAGMWEAMQPSLFAGYVACALAVLTTIIAVRAVINAETPATSSTAPAITAMALLIAAALLVVFSAHLFDNLKTMIIDVIDPHGPPMGGVATTSQTLASRLTRAAFVSVGSVTFLVVCVIVSAVMDPKAPPSNGVGLLLTFASVLAVIGLVVNLISVTSWCSRLQETALTGRVVR
ncbi:MAG TPA: hypothetical protein VER58_16125 [Thermoanaerobaculia bacterium]|nr:hypothetical protein [Thermoanaerobaculia bacterium]